MAERQNQSGGIVAGALEMPRRLFAAARNTKEAGSRTIIGTARVETNSKADEATGNLFGVERKIFAAHHRRNFADGVGGW